MGKLLFILATILSSIGASAQAENYLGNPEKFGDIARREVLIENTPNVESASMEDAIRKSADNAKQTEDLSHFMPKDYNPENEYFFDKSISTDPKPALETRNYDIEDAYIKSPSGDYVAKGDTYKRGRDNAESETTNHTPTIALLILSGILLSIGLIAFKNRDKSKLKPENTNVSNEGKVKLDTLSGIDKLVKEVCQSAPEGLEGLFIMSAIKDRCDSLIKNKSVIAVQNNLSPSSVENVIEECRATATSYYLK